MGDVLRVFPRQTLVFAATDDAYYSEVFDMTNNSTLTLEARLYFESAGSVTTFTVELEETGDPTLSNWDHAAAGTTTLSTSTTKVGQISVTSGLLRFVRVKIKASQATEATMSVDGVSRA